MIRIPQEALECTKPMVLGAAIRAYTLGGSKLTEAEMTGVIGSRYSFRKYGDEMRQIIERIESENRPET